ncbi:hypothetical protein [Paraliomyxa miuraensis]|uniref:hypothetical protein n=1 Tax=Paraliomyxa miuraensis TaxID=376150 RepID=UPI002256471C|nr:hypothetical protein [Paraliomyxa miuraensis]MCX4245645.1 hypothetical protein [Paraliomyxa miuraensis]
MFPCHGCTRHVRDDARQCPFCGASLRTGPSPFHGGFMMGAILGLVLVGCGDPDPGDEEGASTVANTSAATEGSESSSTTTGNATTNGNEAEAADYGTAPPPDDTTGSTGMDTGSTTAGQEGEAADYGAPDTGIGDSATGSSGG